ncbi:hypothetical protein MJO28_011363 [Puccinia striiformis f. sp. tritici]|uniref:Uncharacterized protein n=1 Tax=Puccinia striiformis f. sp. tritici TaxID=168172 RepID=A0ACC0E2C5_9BASI|nr:hypothetical protein MJO28_011363 [Puccinia striiformis f. sp. tritici]
MLKQEIIVHRLTKINILGQINRKQTAMSSILRRAYAVLDLALNKWARMKNRTMPVDGGPRKRARLNSETKPNIPDPTNFAQNQTDNPTGIHGKPSKKFASRSSMAGSLRVESRYSSVRVTRAKICELKNDHRAIVDQLAQTWPLLLPKKGEDSPIPSKDVTTNGSSSSSMVPFAQVDMVTPGSPAEQAGLKLQDPIVPFGPLISES